MHEQRFMSLRYLRAMTWLSMLFATPAMAQQASRYITLETLQSRSMVVLVTVAIVIACVVLHYEALSWLTGLLKRISLSPRRHILVLIFAILFFHIVEIWIFGAGYFYLISSEGHGSLLASQAVSFLDCIYYSAVCFTTLGLGDMVPTGAVRFVTGTEALTGFVLLTWSASFTFFEMQRFWRE
jgi:Ion channel